MKHGLALETFILYANTSIRLCVRLCACVYSIADKLIMHLWPAEGTSRCIRCISERYIAYKSATAEFLGEYSMQCSAVAPLCRCVGYCVNCYAYPSKFKCSRPSVPSIIIKCRKSEEKQRRRANVDRCRNRGAKQYTAPCIRIIAIVSD